MANSGQPMTTDPAVLSKEAGNFERISAELKGVISSVEGTAGALAGQWHGRPVSPRNPRSSDSARLLHVRCKS